MTTKVKRFGDIDLWDFMDKEGLKEHLGINQEDWENYNIVFRIRDRDGSNFADVIGY